MQKLISLLATLLRLMSSTENLKNVRKFHQFLDILSHINISKQSVELCIYHLLFVFNPSHSTSELSQNQTVSYILYIYIEKLNEPGVILQTMPIWIHSLSL